MKKVIKFFFLLFWCNRQFVMVFCGGLFVTDTSRRETKYMGGKKYKIEIDINNFHLVGFEKDVKDVLGFRNLEKMHFRLPGRPLGDGLRLLYDNSVADMLKIVTEHNFVELYTEHKIVRDIYGM